MNLSPLEFYQMDFFRFNLLMQEYLIDKQHQIDFELAKLGQEPIGKYPKNNSTKKKKVSNGDDLLNYLGGV